MAVWLFLASPIVALAVSLTSGVDFHFAIILTLYIWALVCVILALVALAGLIIRLLGRGIGAIRR
jgi:hypothetical protein